METRRIAMDNSETIITQLENDIHLVDKCIDEADLLLNELMSMYNEITSKDNKQAAIDLILPNGNTPISGNPNDFEYTLNNYGKKLDELIKFMWNVKADIPKYNELLKTITKFEERDDLIRKNHLNSDVVVVDSKLTMHERHARSFLINLVKNPIISRAININKGMDKIINDHEVLENICNKVDIDIHNMEKIFNNIMDIWDFNIKNGSVNDFSRYPLQ